MKMKEWFKSILIKFNLMDRPIINRSRDNRRKDERRWQGPDGDSLKVPKDPRRKKERRKKSRRV